MYLYLHKKTFYNASRWIDHNVDYAGYSSWPSFVWGQWMSQWVNSHEQINKEIPAWRINLPTVSINISLFTRFLSRSYICIIYLCSYLRTAISNAYYHVNVNIIGFNTIYLQVRQHWIYFVSSRDELEVVSIEL